MDGGSDEREKREELHGGSSGQRRRGHGAIAGGATAVGHARALPHSFRLQEDGLTFELKLYLVVINIQEREVQLSPCVLRLNESKGRDGEARG